MQKEQVLDLCHNLVVYDEGLDVFRFAHLSVREFLEKRPEFSDISCNILAAESCLLQMVASVDCSSAASYVTDGHVLALHKRTILTETSFSANYFGYSNNFWMIHSELASQDGRSEDSGFGRLFRYFLSTELMRNSALDMWVQSYCSRVQKDEESFQLQSLLNIHVSS